MGVLIRKQKGAHIFTGIGKLSVVGFFMSLSAALIDTVWALYIDSFVHSEVYVGLISAALTVVAFLSYFVFIPLIERTNKSKMLLLSLFLFGITYVLFALNRNFYVFILLAFILTILFTFRITSFGIIIKDKSRKGNLSRNEGLMYTVLNVAWVVGPLIAGYVANKNGISIVFLLASLFIFLAFFTFLFSRIDDAHVKKKIDGNLFKNLKEFFMDKDRSLAYVLGGGVNLWWSFIYLFMPLYIVRHGLNDLWVGYFLFAIAFPLILTEYKFAKMCSKWGFRKTFKRGFLIAAILAFAAFFAVNVYVVLGLLVLASFGLAMVEPTTEAYFFDILKGKDDCRFYGPYNTTIDVNNFIGKICASIVLIFLPFKYLFILFGLFMFLMFLLSSKAKNIIEGKKRH